MDTALDKLAGPEGKNKGHKLAKHWADQITAVKDDVKYKRWIKRAEGIERRYRDERSKADEDYQRRYNALWSNTEILKPALYGKCPIPVVERRFKDKDPVGRFASTILERGLRNEIEICGFDRALKQSVTDYLLPGRGVIWVRYEPEIEAGVSLPIEAQTDIDGADADEDDDETDTDQPVRLRFKSGQNPNMGPGAEGEEAEGEPEADDPDVAALKEEEELEKLHATGDRIVRESTPVDYVPWRDFITLPLRARTWAEVTAVCKRVYMSRDQLKKRFGTKIGNAIPLKRDDRGDLRNSNTASPHQMDEDKGQIYEIWDAGTKKVYWIAEGYDWLCDRRDDPLNLENFFPTPEPITSNQTNDNLLPVPEYIEYQDQAIQIDELTQRIAMLAKACKVAGVYNAAAKDVQRLLQEGVENQLIPVDDWAAFAEDGGVQGAISFLPLEQIITTINELMTIKQRQIEEMDRLTGISDIMRGTTDARETLGAVRIKTNTSGTRISSRQNEIARLARDTVRIMADIMSQHFSPKSLIEVSGAMYAEGLGPNDMPKLSDIMAMMNHGGQPGQPPQMGHGGPLPMGPPGQPPMAGNVVPFPRPGMPPGPPQGGPASMGPPQGMPGQPPIGMPPAPPPVDPKILAKMGSLQRISSAIQLLRNERLRGFRVDIEVDSTVFPDQAQEKADRTEFVGQVTQFLQTSMQMAMTMPEAVPLLSKLLQFSVRGFKVGRDLETAIEEFTDNAVEILKKKQAEQESKPNLAEEKAKSDIAKNNAQAESLKVGAQTNMMKVQSDVQTAQLGVQADREQAQAEVMRQQVENQGEAFNSAADFKIKQMEVQMKQMEMQMKQMEMHLQEQQMHAKLRSDQSEMDMKAQDNAQKIQLQAREADQADQQHRNELEHDKAANAQQLEHEKALSDQKRQQQKEVHAQQLQLKKEANSQRKVAGEG